MSDSFLYRIWHKTEVYIGAGYKMVTVGKIRQRKAMGTAIMEEEYLEIVKH